MTTTPALIGSVTDPCSAWCAPDRRVHVHLERFDTTDIEDIRGTEIGGLFVFNRDGASDIKSCVPDGATCRIIAIDPAPEHAGAFDPRYPGVFLISVQVVQARSVT
jgi:hypothetical protein